MYILHIETSTKICSVALSNGEQLMGWEDQAEGMNHASLLAPMIRRIFEQVKISAGDLGAVSVSSGPGSYTGLRVGSSTAKALAYSLKIPLISVPTLETLSTAVVNTFGVTGSILPMIDARRDEVYSALYNDRFEILWPVQSLHVNREFIEKNLAGLGNVVCCGDGAFKIEPYMADFPNLVLREEIICSARHLVAPTWTRLSRKESEDVLHFVPHYLKPPNITQQKKVG